MNLADIIAAVRSAPNPPPDRVIATPSWEALVELFRAAGHEIVEAKPDCPFTLFGMEVVVTKDVSKPTVLPGHLFRKYDPGMLTMSTDF